MSGSQKGVLLESEIGCLETVIMHDPGPEVEAMTPESAEHALYNDIVPLEVVAREHRALKAFLSLVSRVLDVRTLLTDILSVPEVRVDIVDGIVSFEKAGKRREELLDLPPQELAEVLVTGLRRKDDSLSAFLSGKSFDIPPLPNLYFMRDPAAVYGRSILAGKMATRVRRNEAFLMSRIFAHHPELVNEGFLFRGEDEEPRGNDPVTLEGGDVLVLSGTTAIIGISQRTTTAGVDRFADTLASRIREPHTILAVLLPDQRATIHLDMIFTLLDRDAAMIFEPYILGAGRLTVVRMDIYPGGEKRFTRPESLLSELSRLGHDLEPVSCGGSDPVRRRREQWLSGANFFAFAPGKVIGYDCNTATFEALSKKGFTVRKAEDFLSGRESVNDYRRLAVGLEGVELARGGGGVRCMTMPVRRTPLAGGSGEC